MLQSAENLLHKRSLCQIYLMTAGNEDKVYRNKTGIQG